MNFYSIRDLRTESKTIWKNLASGDEIVITNNGKPSALMIDIPEGNLKHFSVEDHILSPSAFFDRFFDNSIQTPQGKFEPADRR